MIGTLGTLFGLGLYLGQVYYDVPRQAVMFDDTNKRDPLFVGVAANSREFTPALLAPGNDSAYFTDSGHTNTTGLLTYLTVSPWCRYSWVPSEGHRVPRGAIPLGGKPHDPYYIGRAKAGDYYSLGGRVVPREGLMYYPTPEGEKSTSTYEIFKVDYCVNTHQSKHQEKPKNAIFVGYTAEKKPVYVGLGRYHANLIPASIIPGKGMVFTRLGEVITDAWQKIYLTEGPGFRHKWVPDRDGHVPPNAVVINTGSPPVVYIGSAVNSRGDRVVGTINPRTSKMVIPSGDGLGEESVTEYDVLTVFL